MQNPILPVLALGAAALLSGCATGVPIQQEHRPGYERVIDPSARTKGRALCSALDPRTAATVPGCSGAGGISNQDFIPEKGHEYIVAHTEGPVACGLLRPEYKQPGIVPECFSWRKLPETTGPFPVSPPPAPPPPPSVVETSVETGNTQTSVSIVRDDKKETVNSQARAGDVKVSVERVTDTRTGNHTVVFNEGTDNEWTAEFDAATETWSRVAEES